MIANSLACSKRLLYISLTTLVILLYMLVWQWEIMPPEVQKSLPLMLGTFQYFGEKNFMYNTHKFGAVSLCDLRFAPLHPPTIDDTRRTLFGLVKSYVSTMRDLRVETWLAHWTLLGWHWNQRFLPWDNDIALQVSIETLINHLVPRNMTEYSFPVPGGETPRVYLLDINPHCTISSTRDVANKIDGRWIDTSNGKYIDITAVHGAGSSLINDRLFEPAVLFSKDGHKYNVCLVEDEETPLLSTYIADLFPLEDETFESISVKVPHDSARILAAEYGHKSLTNERFHWHRFNRASNSWEPE